MCLRAPGQIEVVAVLRHTAHQTRNRYTRGPFHFGIRFEVNCYPVDAPRNRARPCMEQIAQCPLR